MNIGNTKGRCEFFFNQVWYGFLTWVWYRYLIFRCIGGHSLTESRFILLGLVLSGILIGSLLEFRHQRNGISVFINLTAGYGIYAVLTFFAFRKKMILIVLTAAAVLAFTYGLLVLCRRIRNRERYRQILARRIAKAGYSAAGFLCGGLMIVMVSLGMKALFGTGAVSSAVEPVAKTNVQEQTIANNIETLCRLDEKVWNTLAAEEKLGVLQTVANIEQRYLGLPHELNVSADDMDKNTMGYYVDSTHQIVVNLDELLYGTSFDLVKTVTHEAYHGYQHRLVEAYDEAGDDLKPLLIYYDASLYKSEFADYQDGSEDFFAYYAQDCETDARIYSNDAVLDYFAAIEEHQEQSGWNTLP